MRYKDKDSRSITDSKDLDLFLLTPQTNPNAKYKRSRNFPLPPLPPIEGSDVPLPPNPAPIDTPPVTKDNTLSDYVGKYQITSENNGATYVKFSEPVAIRINGYVLQLVAEKSNNYHAVFGKDGKLRSSYSRLNEPVNAKVGPHSVEISNWVSFGESGNINFLCPAGDKKEFTIGQNKITYHSIGKDNYLQKIFFADDASIRSIHIRDPHVLKVGNYSIKFGHHEGCGGDLDFYPNGSLKGGYLEDAATLENVKYPKGSYIGFTESGTLEKAHFPESLTIQGIPVSKIDDYWPSVEFHKNGKIKMAKGLGRSITIKGKNYSKGKTINFDENGNVQSAY